MSRPDLVAAAELWITVERRVADGRRCRDYRVCDAAGVTLLSARAFNWSRDIRISAADDGTVVLVLRRRRSFPLTGKVDIVALPARTRIGVTSRSGRFVDANGRVGGRFKDARNLRERTRESVLLAAVEVVLGGDGAASESSSPDGYVYTVAGRPAGLLARRRLPFSVAPANTPSAAARVGARLLPIAARRLASRFTAARGWLLQLTYPERENPALVLSAALFMVELSNW